MSLQSRLSDLVAAIGADIKDLRTKIQAASTPLGSTLVTTCKATIPTGYVLANGQRLTQASYQAGYDLAKAEADGGNTEWTYRTSDFTFTVPNLMDRFVYGSGGSKAFGTRAGAETHTLQVSEMPSHNHGGATGSMNRNNPHSHQIGYGIAGVTSGGTTISVPNGANPATYTSVTTDVNHEHTINPQGGGGGHNNMPPYVALPVLVKVA